MGSAIRAGAAEEETSGEKQPRSAGKVTSSRLHTRSELEGSHFTTVGFFTSGFSRGHGETNVSAVEALRVSFFFHLSHSLGFSLFSTADILHEVKEVPVQRRCSHPSGST